MPSSVSVGLLIFLVDSTFGEDVFKVESNTFSEVVQSAAFVDKSLMIREFFNYRYVLISAPQRFGKSINMNMLKKYCEIDINRNRLAKEDTENFKVFSSKYNKTGSLEYLNIYKDVNTSTFFNDTFGIFPVIYLDFKSINGTSFDIFLTGLMKLVYREYKRHGAPFSCNSNKLKNNSFIEINTYYEQLQDRSSSELDLEDSVKLLSETLKMKFNENVIVLIDEYDAPIQSAISMISKDFDKIIDFITRFTSILLKSNTNVERALINSCVRIAGVFLFEANNIRTFPFNEEHPFNEYYGLTENEVIGLIKKFNIGNKMAEIQEWYDGYYVTNSNLKLYNVYSIIIYLESRKFDNYWVQSGYIKMLESILLNGNIRTKISALLDNQAVSIISRNKVTAEDIRILIDVIRRTNHTSLDITEMNLYLQFILDSGYLTCTKRQGEKITLKIPNKEIRNELSNNMVAMYMERFYFQDDDVQEYINSIQTLGTHESSYEEFGNCLLNLFNRNIPQNEFELHEQVSAFARYSLEFRNVSTQVKVNTSKLEIGYGYIDVLILRNDDTGILLELEYHNDVSNTREKFSPCEPLEKIVKNEYYNIFNEHNVTNTILVGILGEQKDKKTGEHQIIMSYLYNSIELKESRTVTINV